MKGNFRLNTLDHGPFNIGENVEDNLLKGLREPGNEDAWDRLFTLSQLKVFQIAKQSGLSTWEAQDVFAEVMVVVVRDVGKSFRGANDTVLVHWVCGIARHRATEFCRERSRLSRLNNEAVHWSEHEEDGAERSELVEILIKEARQHATPGDFASFVLRWFNEMSAKEAGKILNKSAKAVYRGAEKFLEALRAAGRRIPQERKTSGDNSR